MAKRKPSPVLDDTILGMMSESGLSDPAEAIRHKVREHIQLLQTVEAQSPPFNMLLLAGLRDIRSSNEEPTHSPDAELVPDDDGKVSLRLNKDRPLTRQRFSIGHEITHTFFPGYQEKVQCRKPKSRDWADPNDVIEWLCDVGASEFLFPNPWFGNSVEEFGVTSKGIQNLARQYQASTVATVRRLVEISAKPLAALFMTWKTKPTQDARLKRGGNQSLFGSIQEEAFYLRKLRIEYAVTSPAFDAANLSVSNDKSVESDCAIHKASSTCQLIDARESLNLGGCEGLFSIAAIPVYTPEDEFGPNQEKCVVALIEPIQINRKSSKKQARKSGPSLFDS